MQLQKPFFPNQATSAQKCLGTTPLFHGLRANTIGGLVFVVNAALLGSSDKAQAKHILSHIVHTLQQYFPKITRRRKIERSILIMVVMDKPNNQDTAKQKIKSLIQLFYQAYYSEAYDSPRRKGLQERRKKLVQAHADLQMQSKKCATRLQAICAKSQALLRSNRAIQQADKDVSEKFRTLLQAHKSKEDDIKEIESQINNLLKESNQIKDQIKRIDTALKNIEEAPYLLAIFFSMLLMQDVPKDQIGDLDNFILDNSRFCYIYPPEPNNVQAILD